MNKIIKGLFYLSVVMLLVSCATTRFEPKENGDCLIIGRLEVECEGWNDDVGMLNIDGVYKRGATISLTDATTGKTFTTKTVGYDGLFIFGNLEFNRIFFVCIFLFVDYFSGDNLVNEKRKNKTNYFALC